MWDVIVVTALLITLIALPIDIAFYTQPGEHGEEHGGENIDHSSSPGEHTVAPQSRSDNGTGQEHGGGGSDSGDEVTVFGKRMSHGKYIWFMSNFVCELFFMSDIVLDFRTGYIDDETDEV